MQLLAEAVTSPWTPSNILIAIGGLILGGGGAAAVIGIFAKGYWAKNVEPLILEAITKHSNTETVREAREKEVLDLVSAYLTAEQSKKAREAEISGVFSSQHTAEQAKKTRQEEIVAHLRSPEVLEERERAIKRVIDNEIARTDGLIHVSVAREVNQSEARLGAKLDSLTVLLREDSQFRQEMLAKMNRLEGALQVLVGGRRTELEAPKS